MNPTLPPLPLVDGCYLIDNSSLTKLLCPRAFQYSSINKRSLVDTRAGRNFGSTLHIGWKWRYALCGTGAVDAASEATINSEMAKWLAENPQPLDDFRTLEHAQRVMKAYNQRYKIEPFRILPRADGAPAIESSFIFDLGRVEYPGVINGLTRPNILVKYIGRVDLFVEDNSGEWVWDHKTAFQFGKGFARQMESDPGQLGYCWAFREFYGHLPRGYVIDAVRIRRPKKEDEYTGTAPVDSTDLDRMPFYVMPDTIDEWQENALRKVALIFRRHAEGVFEKNESHCEGKYGQCDYYSVCSVPRPQRDTILTSTQYEDNTWSPLNVPGV